MKNFAGVMFLLFGSAGARTYSKSGQVAPPRVQIFELIGFGFCYAIIQSNLQNVLKTFHLAHTADSRGTKLF